MEGWIKADLRFLIKCLEDGTPREQIVEFIKLDMLYEDEPLRCYRGHEIDPEERAERLRTLREEVDSLQQAWEDEGAEWGDRLSEALSELREAEQILPCGCPVTSGVAQKDAGYEHAPQTTEDSK